MKFEKMVIDNNNDKILEEIVQLHINSLGYRSFITQFGNEFLLNIYRIILNSKIGFIYYVEQDGVIIGFVCVIYGNKRLLIELSKNLKLFIFHVIKGILKKGKLFCSFLSSFSYVQKSKKDIPCELLVIAVHPLFRSKKIGQRLVQLVDEELVHQNIYEYKVTVHKEMVRSREFYQSNGFCLFDEFEMNDTRWCIYNKKII